VLNFRLVCLRHVWSKDVERVNSSYVDWVGLFWKLVECDKLSGCEAGVTRVLDSMTLQECWVVSDWHLSYVKFIGVSIGFEDVGHLLGRNNPGSLGNSC